MNRILQAADANGDGVIDRTEWARYASRRAAPVPNAVTEHVVKSPTEAVQPQPPPTAPLTAAPIQTTVAATVASTSSPTASPTDNPTASPTPPPTPTAIDMASSGVPGMEDAMVDRTYGPGAPFGEKGPTCVVPRTKRPKDTSVVLSSCSLTHYPGMTWEDGCRNSCCAECALQLPIMHRSPQAQRFRRKVLDKTTKTMKMVTIGNSVARENNFQTMRSFQATMQADFPHIQWTTDLNQGITGGVSQQTMYRSLHSEKAKDFHGADVIVIQYSQFAHCEQCIYAEELLRVLLALESQPLVILVEHIARGGFDPNIPKAEWRWYNNNVTLWEEISAGERGLAAHYNLPFVSTRAGVKTFIMDETETKKTFLEELPYKSVHSACLADKTPEKLHSSLRSMDAKAILSSYYNDHLHFSQLGNAMAGCLLADTARSIVKSSAASIEQNAVATLPGPFLADTKERMGATSKSETVFISSTHHKSLFPQHLSTLTEKELTASTAAGGATRVTEGQSYLENFRFRQGGRGGKKVWLHTTTPGAVLSFVTPKPCTTIQLEMYKHHELPMGSAEVRIDGQLVKTLDACCPKTCIDNGDGIKRGWYYVETLAEKLENKVHTVEVKVVPKASTQCTELGNQFDISSIIGSTDK